MGWTKPDLSKLGYEHLVGLVARNSTPTNKVHALLIANELVDLWARSHLDKHPDINIRAWRAALLEMALYEEARKRQLKWLPYLSKKERDEAKLIVGKPGSKVYQTHRRDYYGACIEGIAEGIADGLERAVCDIGVAEGNRGGEPGRIPKGIPSYHAEAARPGRSPLSGRPESVLPRGGHHPLAAGARHKRWGRSKK